MCKTSLLHFGEHALVLGQAQGFVEFALRAIEFDVARDEGLLGQVGEHVLLAPAQQQGRDAPAQALAAVDIVMLLDWRAVKAREVAIGSKQARFDRIELRPQFAKMVFQWRAGHGQAPSRGNLAHDPGRLALGVLHHL